MSFREECIKVYAESVIEEKAKFEAQRKEIFSNVKQTVIIKYKKMFDRNITDSNFTKLNVDGIDNISVIEDNGVILMYRHNAQIPYREYNIINISFYPVIQCATCSINFISVGGGIGHIDIKTLGKLYFEPNRKQCNACREKERKENTLLAQQEKEKRDNSFVDKLRALVRELVTYDEHCEDYDDYYDVDDYYEKL